MHRLSNTEPFHQPRRGTRKENPILSPYPLAAFGYVDGRGIRYTCPSCKKEQVFALPPGVCPGLAWEVESDCGKKVIIHIKGRVAGGGA